MILRFHLDEDVNHFPKLTAALIARGIDVTNSATANLFGAIDEKQLAYATREGRVIVTHNVSDFARLNRDQPGHAGIICVHQQTLSLGEMIRRLVEIHHLVEPAEMHSRLTYL